MRCSISFVINTLAPIGGRGDTAAAPALCPDPRRFPVRGRRSVEPEVHARAPEGGPPKWSNSIGKLPEPRITPWKGNWPLLIPWQSFRVMSTQFLGAALSRLLNCVATGSPMGQHSSSTDLELAPKGQSLISAGCLRSVYCGVHGVTTRLKTTLPTPRWRTAPQVPKLV